MYISAFRIRNFRSIRDVQLDFSPSLNLLIGRNNAGKSNVLLAHRGWPILGDAKYGSPVRLNGTIALHAASLTFRHPTKGEPVKVTAEEPEFWRELA
jgi:hypothetical protein